MNSGSASGVALSEAEVCARLQRLEIEQGLLQPKAGRWAAWPLLRTSVGGALQNLPLDAGGARFTRGETWRQALRDLPRLLRARRARYVVKTYSSAHMEFVEGRKKDVFFDDLLQATGDGYKIEAPNRRDFFLSGAGYVVPPDVSMVGLEMIAARLALYRPIRSVASAAAALAEGIRRGTGVESLTPELIAARLSGFLWETRVWRWLLRRVKPRAVLVADSGEFPIIAAARELGIDVVEFQHGFTHRHYPGNSWTRDALPFKPTMPLPTRIFTFGPHWSGELAANGFWTDELRAVGSTRVDHYRRLPRARDPGRCTIVVTTQGTDTARLVAFLSAFVRLAETRGPFELRIKFHPVYHAESRAFDALAAHPRVRCIAGSEQPSTFELLRQADLHVSIYSTCHYEALALGVPTAILPLIGHENVMHLHASGDALLARTPAELADLVARGRELRVPPGAGERYFTPGALENAQRELAAL